MSERIASRWALWIGPVLATLVFGLGMAFGLGQKISATVAVTTLCAVYWVFEPIPIPVTSLIPFVAFPLFGVINHEDVARAYGHTLILLLLGGFILSTSLERSGAHRRLALGMVRLVGGRGRRGLVLGFMTASAVCSMWISNTATTLMLLPVALAVIGDTEDESLTVPLLLGIAYAASIGGLGTPVGTPPNLVFLTVYKDKVGIDVGFVQWMKIGVPVVVIFLPLAWLWLTRRVKPGVPIELPRLGPWRASEKRVLVVFAVTALAWMTRVGPFGGWSVAVPFAGDSTVALAAVVALFVLPNGEGGRMLDWETAERIPWGLLLLFGGGIAIAKAFKASGLSNVLGQQFAPLADWPVLLMIVVICLAVTFLTEITSNTATTWLLMPILATAGLAAHVDPILLMAPAALSASCAFMLPVATAPNAIIFGTGRVSIKRMVREGVALNLVGVAVISAIVYLILG